MARYRKAHAEFFSFLGTIAAAFVLCIGSSTAQASPLCNILDVSLNDFVSCVVDEQGPAGQDTLPNVESALNDAINDVLIALLEDTSYCPASTCANSEFLSNVAGVFETDPVDFLDSNPVTFEVIPMDTAFISIKQGNAFEVFKVPGPTPFGLTTMLSPDGCDEECISHISTFATDGQSVAEPASLGILGVGLLGMMGLLRRKRHLR